MYYSSEVTKVPKIMHRFDSWFSYFDIRMVTLWSPCARIKANNKYNSVKVMCNQIPEVQNDSYGIKLIYFPYDALPCMK
jgi:hypothetical protein